VLQGGFNSQTNALSLGQQGTISQSNTQFADPSGDQTLSNTASATLSQAGSQTAGAQTNTNASGAQAGSQTATATSSGSGSLGNLISQTVLNSVAQAGENQQVNGQSLTQIGTIGQVNLQAPPP
jgi:hypothetical protein